MSWRETAQIYSVGYPISNLLTEAEAKLASDDWIQQAGAAIKFQYGDNVFAGPVIYVVSTRLISISPWSMDSWRELAVINVTDLPYYGIERSRTRVDYFAETPAGPLVISVESQEQATALAQAIRNAYMHRVNGFTLTQGVQELRSTVTR